MVNNTINNTSYFQKCVENKHSNCHDECRWTQMSWVEGGVNIPLIWNPKKVSTRTFKVEHSEKQISRKKAYNALIILQNGKSPCNRWYYTWTQISCRQLAGLHSCIYMTRLSSGSKAYPRWIFIFHTASFLSPEVGPMTQGHATPACLFNISK